MLDRDDAILERHLYDGCPLCTAADITDLGTGDCSGHALYDPRLSASIRWKTCADCGHVFTEGYFTDAACDIIFARTNASQKVGHQLEANRAVSARIIDRVVPFQSAGRWLDIGFGNGAILFTAREYGFHPVGVDLRRENVETMQQLGYEAYCEDLLTLDLTPAFQVISLLDVLEHVPFPVPFLTKVASLLAPGGVCLLSMPNSDQILWDFMSLNGRNPYWGEIEHYHNFSRSRLYALLREVGLTPVRYGISERYKACMEVVAVKG